MKIITLSTFFILCISSALFAQTNDSNKSIRIKAIDSISKFNIDISIKLPPIKGLTNKNIRPSFNFNPLTDFSKQPSGVDITEKSSLVDKEWEIKQKFKEGDKNASKFAKDYSLGDIKTTSKTVVIKMRDHEYVDGDRVKLMLNNVVIHPNITLRGDYFTIDIDLQEGFNSINFIALNEGLSSPNTAQLKVFDADGNQIASNKWLITTGYKASLIILKE
jgi:hypothetical protein